MPGYTLKSHGDLKYISFDMFSRTGLVDHAFTTRLGGISAGPFGTLNLALHVGDAAENVLENRKTACRVMGSALENMVCGQQVHGDRVHVVAGTGHTIPGTDALVTDRPGMLLASFYADCVPVMILDPVKRAIALAHAGWKGTLKRIAGSAVRTMNSAFGTDPGDCLAAIAPSIGPCCYEVDLPVINAVSGAGINPGLFADPAGQGKWKLDLRSLNRALLLEAGLKPDRIVVADLCTCCNPELFFSYRYSGRSTGSPGECGRMASIMVLR